MQPEENENTNKCGEKINMMGKHCYRLMHSHVLNYVYNKF